MSQIDDIVGQMLVAFGHGIGSVRVPRDTVRALTERYRPTLEKGLADQWDDDGVQVLERVRATGRLAAQNSVVRGDTKVTQDDFATAAMKVEAESKTPWCPTAKTLEA